MRVGPKVLKVTDEENAKFSIGTEITALRLFFVGRFQQRGSVFFFVIAPLSYHMYRDLHVSPSRTQNKKKHEAGGEAIMINTRQSMLLTACVRGLQGDTHLSSAA